MRKTGGSRGGNAGLMSLGKVPPEGVLETMLSSRGELKEGRESRGRISPPERGRLLREKKSS